MKNELSKNKRIDTTFLHLGASCLEMGRVTLPQINTNLYSVPRIFVLKIQNDPSTRNQVIILKPLCLHAEGQ